MPGPHSAPRRFRPRARFFESVSSPVGKYGSTGGANSSSGLKKFMLSPGFVLYHVLHGVVEKSLTQAVVGNDKLAQVESYPFGINGLNQLPIVEKLTASLSLKPLRQVCEEVLVGVDVVAGVASSEAKQCSPDGQALSVPPGQATPHFPSAFAQVVPQRVAGTVVGTVVGAPSRAEKTEAKQCSPVGHLESVPSGHGVQHFPLAVDQSVPQRLVAAGEEAVSVDVVLEGALLDEMTVVVNRERESYQSSRKNSPTSSKAKQCSPERHALSVPSGHGVPHFLFASAQVAPQRLAIGAATRRWKCRGLGSQGQMRREETQARDEDNAPQRGYEGHVDVQIGHEKGQSPHSAPSKDFSWQTVSLRRESLQKLHPRQAARLFPPVPRQLFSPRSIWHHTTQPSPTTHCGTANGSLPTGSFSRFDDSGRPILGTPAMGNDPTIDDFESGYSVFVADDLKTDRFCKTCKVGDNGTLVWYIYSSHRAPFANRSGYYCLDFTLGPNVTFHAGALGKC
ncbi:hypothetical protein DFJ73DRAFT_758612 [Zopfochytrium polystomum]|nr:hypothetical protein DFJ73DRAFT_758612 [Zopfochytrium polystomum]